MTLKLVSHEECEVTSRSKQRNAKRKRTLNKQQEFSHHNPTFGLELRGRQNGSGLGQTWRANSRNPKTEVSLGLAKEMKEPRWMMERR